jgi:signal transduction histidine kinase
LSIDNLFDGKMTKLKFIPSLIIVALFFLTRSLTAVSEDVNYLKDKLKSANTNGEKLQYLSKISDFYIDINDKLAIKYALEYLKIAKSSNNDTLKIIAYHQFGRANQSIPNYTTAIEYYLRAQNLCLKIGNKKMLAPIYKDLGESYRSFFEYSSSLNYLQKSLQLYRKLKDKLGEAKVLNRIGAVYAEFNNEIDRKKSLYFINKSNLISESKSDYDLLSSNYLLLGADYSYFKNYKKSFAYLDSALIYMDKCTSKDDKSLILKAIAVIYYFMGDNSQSIKYGQLAYQDAVKSNNLTYIWLSTNILTTVYDKIHNADSALKYLKISAGARSSLYMKEKDIAVYRSEAKYQREFYQHEKLEEQNRDKEKTILFISIIIAFIAILTFSIIRFRILKKTYKELNIQKEIIEQQKSELAIVNNTKDKFFSIIAHDLKSPFHSILGLSRELELNVDSMEMDDIRNFARGINKSSQVTYNLLENLLEWAKLQTGRITPKPEVIEIKNLIDLIIDMVQVPTYKKNITIISSNIGNSVFVYTDSNMLTSVVRNLIINAIKFSPKNKSIFLLSQIIGDKLEVTVHDEGIGIGSKQLSELFNIEFTTSTLGTDNEAGSGLGLILCKELIEKQGGTISVQSELGVGSSFSITIPLAKQNK